MKNLQVTIRPTAFGFDTIIDEAVEILNGKREITGIERSEARKYLLAQNRK